MTAKLPGMERSEEIRQADILRIVREKLAGFKDASEDPGIAPRREATAQE